MKIFAVGMNYIQHNKELDGALYKPESPVIFTKADSALLKDHKPFFIPDWSSQVDYETELVVRICRLGKSIPERFARRYYDAVTVGIDFTARDIQREARAKGLPWELCKGFDHSAALSPEFVPLAELGGDINNLEFEMELNGEVRQRGFTKDMLFSVDKIISHVSKYMTLKIGDLIYTGTPVGVGPVQAGDNIKARIGGRTLLDFDVR